MARLLPHPAFLPDVRLTAAACLPTLVESLSGEVKQKGGTGNLLLGDSMPVFTCSAKRKGRVAPELADKGYCATKKLHYYGVKLHVLAVRRPGRLPVPEFVGVTAASEHDLTALRPALGQLYNTKVVFDKA